MALPVLAIVSSPAAPPPPTSDTLIVGFFEDGQNENTNAEFSAAIADLVAHGLNGFMFTVDAAPPAISDLQAHFYQIQAPMTPLYALYPSSSTSVSDATARAVIEPLATAVLGHPSVIGLNIRDDAQQARNAQFIQQLAIFAETLPSMPISPLIVARGRNGWNVHDIVKPKCWMGYEFPFKQDVPSHDWTQNGRYFKEWYEWMRMQWQTRTTGPLWLNLQGHETVNTISPDVTSDLRQPSPAEISAEMWIAFGEEANAICVYIYSTVTGGGIGLSWTGIKDLPTHYARIAAEAAKLLPLENNYRIQSTKIPDRFAVSGDHQYISTFRNNSVADTYYVVVVNTQSTTQNLQVTSVWYDGDLYDLTTLQTYALGDDIPFVAGEGRMFRLINFSALTPPSPQANLLTNGDAEGGTAGWTVGNQPTVVTNVYHSGTASFKAAVGTTDYRRSITSILTANTTYYLSYWEKFANLLGTVNSKVGINILQTAPTINPNEICTLSWDKKGTQDWRKIVGWFRTPATGTAWRLDIVGTLASGEDYWVDDIFLAPAKTYSDIDEYLIERLTPPAGVTTFRPSDYGSVTGTNATTDTALIQAAIDAAVTFDAPCRVLLEDTYAVGARGGKITIGANRNCAYGFRIPELAHDIEFDATGAAFVYTQVPSLTSPNTATSYTLFQIGQGWDLDVDGTWTPTDDPNWLTDKIRYTERITLLFEGCTWDSSLLTDANLLTLSGGVIGGCIQFAACLNCSIDGCDIDRGYGHTGAIGCNTWTRYLTATNCTIGTAHTTAFWFDGVWDSVFTNLNCHDFIATASTSGLVLAPNTDNRRVSERNTVTNCDFSEVHDGIVMQGSTNTIDGCAILLIGDNVTHEGFLVQTPASTERGTWECDGNIIRNCTVDRPSSSPSQKGYGVKLKGSATSFSGGVVRVMNTLIENNNFGSGSGATEKLGQGVNLSTYAVNNTIQNNIVDGTAVTFDDSAGTATGNTITGNTLT